jgi:hypothetical protein
MGGPGRTLTPPTGPSLSVTVALGPRLGRAEIRIVACRYWAYGGQPRRACVCEGFLESTASDSFAWLATI